MLPFLSHASFRKLMHGRTNHVSIELVWLSCGGWDQKKTAGGYGPVFPLYFQLKHYSTFPVLLGDWHRCSNALLMDSRRPRSFILNQYLDVFCQNINFLYSWNRSSKVKSKREVMLHEISPSAVYKYLSVCTIFHFDRAPSSFIECHMWK